MKTISIAGRAGKNAEVRTHGDTPVANFSVAADDGWGDNKSTMWFDCSMWGTRGEKVAQYITKGTPLSLSGELGIRLYDGKTYLTVRVAELTLQGSRDSPQSSPPPAQGGFDDDSDIPFAPELR